MPSPWKISDLPEGDFNYVRMHEEPGWGIATFKPGTAERGVLIARGMDMQNAAAIASFLNEMRAKPPTEAAGTKAREQSDEKSSGGV